MNSNYRFTYTDELFAKNKKEAKEKLLELYAKEGLLGILDMLFNEKKFEDFILGGTFKRVKK